jgi:hypothetical protein
MKYAVEMGSSAMIYIPSFLKTTSGNSEVDRMGILRHTDSMVIA